MPDTFGCHKWEDTDFTEAQKRALLELPADGSYSEVNNGFEMFPSRFVAARYAENKRWEFALTTAGIEAARKMREERDG